MTEKEKLLNQKIKTEADNAQTEENNAQTEIDLEKAKKGPGAVRKAARKGIATTKNAALGLKNNIVDRLEQSGQRKVVRKENRMDALREQIDSSPKWTLDDEIELKNLKGVTGGRADELRAKRVALLGGGVSMDVEGVPSESILPKPKKEKPAKPTPPDYVAGINAGDNAFTIGGKSPRLMPKVERTVSSKATTPAVETPPVAEPAGEKDLIQERATSFLQSVNDQEPEDAPLRGGWKAIKEFFKRKTKPVEVVTPTAIEEEEVNKEVKDLPKEKQEKLGWGIKTLGLKLRQTKNYFFTNTLGAIGKRFDKKSTMGRFSNSLKESFEEDAKRDNALAKKRSGLKGQVLDKLTLVGNIAKYGRLIMDFTTHSIASPFRYYILAAMAATRGFEAAKGARLKNEEVISKTRYGEVDGELTVEGGRIKIRNEKDRELLKNIEKAYEEAWAIHEKALGKAGDEAVSKEALENAYLAEMPKDIMERLKDTSVANGMVQKLVKKQMEKNLARLEKAINKIEKNDGFSKEQKEEKKMQVLKSWKKVIDDYDRIVSQVGAVDGLATAALYTQKVSRGVVYALTAETLYTSFDKLARHMADAFASAEFHNAEALSQAATESRTLPNLNKIPSGKIIDDLSNDVRISELEPLNPDAVIQKGDGIENVFIRQIEHNEDLAKSLTWDGKEDLHHFAQRQAHLLAINQGYVSADGQEIRVGTSGIDKVAYEIKMVDGEPTVVEKDIAGKIIETHSKENTFEKDIEKYEYEYSKEKAAVASGANLVSENNVPESSTVPAENISNVDQKIMKGVKFAEVPDSSPEELVRGKIEEQYQAASVEEPGTYKAYQHPTQQVIDQANAQRANATYRPYNSPGQDQIYGNNAGTGERLRYYELSPGDNHVLKNNPDFDHKFYDLTPKERLAVFRTNERIADTLFGSHEGPVWRSISNLRADKAIEGTSNKTLADYLTMLKNFAEQDGEKFKPKSGGLFSRAETVEHYIARGLQKLASTGKLEEFESNLRK